MTYFSYGQVLKTSCSNLYQKSMSYTPPIRFDFNYSKTQILSLDITITKLSTVKLLTTLYKKEIDQQSYLHRKSEHSETLKQSIPYSHTQILKRIFTTEENFTENLKCSQSG